MIHATFNISITNDDIQERNEDFILIIDQSSLSSNVTAGDIDQASVTIEDNDGEFTVS